MLRCFSSLSATFVSNLFPKGGEEVLISIAVYGDVSGVFLRHDCETGLNRTVGMERVSTMGRAVLYQAGMPVFSTDEKIRYYFVVEDGGGDSFYYSKSGLSRIVPSVKHRFEIIPDLDAPSWVGNSTCYQIFPDRFCNGDPSNDVSAGAYVFDGAAVTTPSFSDRPKSFDEARCVDFYNGDLKGIEDKLDHIKKMGFDTIYLNPVNSSRTVHRFDSIDFFHVDDKLGGDEAYLSLLEKAHSKGMRIIQDISINHTGSDHPWFLKAKEDPSSEEAGFYYRKPDGSFRYWAGVGTLPQLNFNSDKLRNLLYRDDSSAMKKYLKSPYNLDAWRLDVAPELARAGSDQLCRQVWREVRSELKKVRKELYLVGEDWDDSSDYMQGDMWDATMNYYGSGRIIRSWLGEKDRFLLGAWGHAPEKARPFSSDEFICAVYEALCSVPDQSVYFQMNLIDSHDTPRLHNNDDVMDDDIYLGGIAALYFLPGMPNVYYGDEIKLDGAMGSVEGSRYPMQWDEGRWNRKYLEWHEKLGAIRKTPGFGYSAFGMKRIDDGCFLISRYLKSGTYVAVINRQDDPCEFCIDDVFAGFNDVSVVLGDVRLKDGGVVATKKRQSAVLFVR